MESVILILSLVFYGLYYTLDSNRDAERWYLYNHKPKYYLFASCKFIVYTSMLLNVKYFFTY